MKTCVMKNYVYRINSLIYLLYVMFVYIICIIAILGIVNYTCLYFIRTVFQLWQVFNRYCVFGVFVMNTYQ